MAMEGEIPVVTKKWVSIFSGTSLPAISFNFINSIIGSGVIGMPLAISESGIIVALVLFGFVFFLADYSLLTLISNGNKFGTNTYQDLVHRVLGKWGYVVISILQFAYPFIALISYNVVIGDTLTKVAIRLFRVNSDSIITNRYFIVCIVSLLITLPLCLPKKFSALAKTSFLSCILLIFVTIAMIIRLFTQRGKFEVNYENILSTKMDVLNLSNSFAIMAFAFMTQHNSFLIYHSMSNPNYSDWKKVTHISLLGSVLFSILFGMIGYLSFGSETQGDVFESYCVHDDLINVARFAYAIIIMFSFPLEGVVCREVLMHLVARLGHEDFFHYFIAILVVAASVGCSFINKCLEAFLELNGSITATLMAYVLPSLITMTVYYQHEKNRNIKSYILPAFVLLTGTFFAVFGMISVVSQLIEGYDCLEGAEPSYCLDLLEPDNETNLTTVYRFY